AFGHATTGLAVAGNRPALEARRVQAPEDPRAAFVEGLDLEVLLPHPAIAQVLRQARDEQIGRLQDVPVGRDDEILLRHGDVSSARPKTCAGAARYRSPPG